MKTEPEGETRVAAVVGASSNPERFSNKAVAALLAAGWKALPVTPAGGAIHGVEALKSLEGIEGEVHTVALYVNPKISSTLEAALLKLMPKRVVFNPGAENEALRERLSEAGIQTVEDCVLVMLKAGRF